MPGDPREDAARRRPRQGQLISARTSIWAAPYRATSIGIVALVTLFAFEGIGTATAMPVVARDLNALGGYTWAFSAYVVASLFSMVVGGIWSDARGPRDPLIVSVIAFAVGAVICGFANGLPVLVLGRSVQGLGGGALIVGLYVVIAKAYSVEMRPAAFSVLAASWIVPSLIGPLIAGWLADHVTWRAVFLLVPVLVILPTLLMFPTIRGLHDGTPQSGVRRRLIAGALATVGLFAFQDGVLRINAVGAVEASIGLVLLIFGLRPLLPPGALFLRRGLPTSVVMRGFLAAGYFSAEAFVPLALVETRRLSTTQAGLVLAVAAGFWFLGSSTQARLPGTQDRSRVVRAGALVLAVALLTLPLVVLTAVPPWLAAVSWAAAAFGMGLALPSAAVQVLRLSPEPDQGANSAGLQISDSVMSTLAISVVGLVYAVAVAGGGATPSTYATLWVMAAAIVLVGAAVAGRMRPLPIDIGG